MTMDLSHLKNDEVQQQALLSDGERRLIIQKTHWFDYLRIPANVTAHSGLS